MKFFFLLFACSLSLISYSQDKKTKDSLDRAVIAEFITPAQVTTKQNGTEPDWSSISKSITAKYSTEQTDRAVTRAQIYYYYSKDWPKFCAALIHFTDKYEDKQDAKLMNLNAVLIYQHSESKEDLTAAAEWSKHAVDKEPGNDTYKVTYDALIAKTATN